jgi:signal transduction histidine kinase
MFSNLIENAIRHTPACSRIRLAVAIHADRALFRVCDNGEGIPREEYAKVTRRFYRISNSRTTAGHGLGLALVAAIAQLHHAALSFDDAQPGLEVSVEFPLGNQRPGIESSEPEGCSTSMRKDPGRVP